MNTLLKILTSCFFLSFSTLPSAQEPNKNVVLVSQGVEDGYEEDQIFIDKLSIKKISNKRVLFNLISDGLSLDESITYENPEIVDKSSEFESMDNSQVIITSQMDCNTKELKPIEYLEINKITGEKRKSTPKIASQDSGQFSEDDIILKNIFNIVCA